jgi:hypothetical protein
MLSGSSYTKIRDIQRRNIIRIYWLVRQNFPDSPYYSWVIVPLHKRLIKAKAKAFQRVTGETRRLFYRPSVLPPILSVGAARPAEPTA